MSILNAIYHAVGVRVGTLPANSKKIKKALEEKEAGTYSPQEKFYLGSDFDETLDYMKSHPKTKYSGVVIDH